MSDRHKVSTSTRYVPTREPHDHVRHESGQRFHVRYVVLNSGPVWEIYSYGLEHICYCRNAQIAQMVANCLEFAGETREGREAWNDSRAADYPPGRPNSAYVRKVRSGIISSN